MNRSKTSIFQFVWVVFVFFLWTQDGLFAQPNIYAERTHLITNKSMYFTGEDLRYSVYCLSQKDGSPSSLSKIAYVELFDAQGEVVEQQKVGVSNGSGEGKIFVGERILTGNYILRAYTRWMRNFSQKTFFEMPVTIINPFASFPKTDDINTEPENEPLTTNKDFSNTIKFTNLQKVHNQREEVNVTIDIGSLKLDAINVSVYRDLPDSLHLQLPKARATQTNFNNFKLETGSGDPIVLPEKRALIMTGKVDSSISGPLFCNTLGNNTVVSQVLTDREGRFNIELPAEISYDQVVVWSESDSLNIGELEIVSEYDTRAPYTKVGNLHITRELKEFMIENSAYIQIDKAYELAKKSDDDKPGEVASPFYGRSDWQYDLDDYSRFPKVRDSFIEYVRSTIVRKRKKREYIHVYSQVEKDYFKEPALVMVDGIPVDDITRLMGMVQTDFSRINVVGEKIIIGSTVFYGIVDLHTTKGGMDKAKVFKKSQMLSFKGISKVEDFDSIKVPELINDKRYPYFSNTLLWQANTAPDDQGNIEVRFFTSDELGKYTIKVSGLTQNGEFMSFEKSFFVSSGNF